MREGERDGSFGLALIVTLGDFFSARELAMERAPGLRGGRGAAGLKLAAGIKGRLG